MGSSFAYFQSRISGQSWSRSHPRLNLLLSHTLAITSFSIMSFLSLILYHYRAKEVADEALALRKGPAGGNLKDYEYQKFYEGIHISLASGHARFGCIEDAERSIKEAERLPGPRSSDLYAGLLSR